MNDQYNPMIQEYIKKQIKSMLDKDNFKVIAITHPYDGITMIEIRNIDPNIAEISWDAVPTIGE